MNKKRGLSMLSITFLLFQLLMPGIGLAVDQFKPTETTKSDNTEKIAVKEIAQDEDSITWKVWINQSGTENEGTETKLKLDSGLNHGQVTKRDGAEVVKTSNGYTIKTPEVKQGYGIEIKTDIKDKDKADFTIEATADYSGEKFKASDKALNEGKIERDRIAAEKAEQERIAQEKAAAEKAEQERIAKEKAAAEKAEAEKVAKEKAAEKAEAEKVAKEKAAEKAEQERIAQEKAEAEEAEQEKSMEKPMKEGVSEQKKLIEEPMKEEVPEREKSIEEPEKLMEVRGIMPLALLNPVPNNYEIAPNTSLLYLTGSSTNNHSQGVMAWYDAGGEFHIAVQSTHVLDGTMKLYKAGILYATSDDTHVYDKLTPLIVDGDSYSPKIKYYNAAQINGNTNDARWSVYVFNDADVTAGQYTFDVTGIGGGHDIIGQPLTIAIPKTDVTATKEWIGGTESRPTIQFQLYRNIAGGIPEAIGDVKTLNNGTLSAEWTDLDKTDEKGNDYIFTVKEVAVPTGYKASYEGLKVINTFVPKIDIAGTKKWEGGSTRPSIDLQLKRYLTGADPSTATLVETGTVDGTPGDNEDPAWRYNWKDMPKNNDSDIEYIYFVDEEIVPENYEKTLDPDKRTVINTYKSPLIDIPVTKEWVGPESGPVTITLIKDGEATNKSLELDGVEDNWSGSFDGLPENKDDGSEIVYTVVESEVDTEKYDSSVVENTDGSFTVTNTNTEKTEISVDKLWIGPVGDSVTITLYAGEQQVTDEDPLVLTADDDWTGSFTGLDKYNDDGTKIVYTVVESDVDTDKYDSSVVENEDGSFTVTNTQILGSLEITKVDEEGVVITTGADFELQDLDGNIIRDLITTGLDGKYKFEDLPPGDYKLVEKNAPVGYELRTIDLTVTVEGGKQTNKTIENKKKKGKVIITKIGADDAALEGAKFELTDSSGTRVGIKESNDSGEIIFDNLEWGEYTLKETKAPEGYRLLEREIGITIAKDNLTIEKTIKNTKQGWEIPDTGGIGALGFYGLGILLMVIAAWFIFRRRKA